MQKNFKNNTWVLCLAAIILCIGAAFYVARPQEEVQGAKAYELSPKFTDREYFKRDSSGNNLRCYNHDCVPLLATPAPGSKQ
ncbi:MAG: hypothetical protein A2831_03320 [Candidatus Yanofskybacteria bacterium RIFCSPHIGHO2_01_FULL_44_17]|uniref:Uncharacterized protein n=1 Tax=Candidatus Yanofskybacteria bacterium RIFCSPHIGHO2_01_FULL_44_17 TaxID=1802668 RepID=A0A1F8EXW1_9BACT|nr:MAG: hypothetical protein A2831_03320 [Candidatus Yanofskybacteria bacterium RIFCSPHIGHO2_01_FULL_44_17]